MQNYFLFIHFTKIDISLAKLVLAFDDVAFGLIDHMAGGHS